MKTLKISGIIAATVGLMLLIFYYYTHDPSTSPAPKCMFKLLTGWDCPGCGSQRALHAILHGRFGEAWSFNPFVFFATPAAAFYLIVEARRNTHPRIHAAAVHPVIVSAIAVGCVIYTILRNIL